MDNKNTVYVKEPTFLSPMDIHFRMMSSNSVISEMSKIISEERTDTIVGNRMVEVKNSGYTLKRTK